MFEYSPKRSAVNIACESQTKIHDAKKRFFPPVCCIANDLSFTDDSLSKDVDEKKVETRAGDANPLAKASYDYEGVFSEDSLMTDDQSSDSKSTTRDWNLLSIAKDIPYIDETTTGTNASQSADTDDEPKITENMQIVISNEAQKETVRHVSWPDCISSCACIPSREDDDSFTVYSSSQEKCKISGVQLLPDETESDNQAVNVSVEYKITDDESGMQFIAAKMPLSNR